MTERQGEEVGEEGAERKGIIEKGVEGLTPSTFPRNQKHSIHRHFLWTCDPWQPLSLHVLLDCSETKVALDLVNSNLSAFMSNVMVIFTSAVVG